MVRPWANDGKVRGRGSVDPEPPGKANGKGRDGQTPNNTLANAHPSDAPNRGNNAAGRPETNPPGATWVISGYPDSDPAAASPAWPGPWSWCSC